MNTTIERNLDALKHGFCGLTIFTAPKCKKGAPSIRKLTKQVVMLCGYESAVNRRAAQEGLAPEFRAESLWGGKGRHITKYLVEHVETGKRYLAYTPVKTIHEEWLADGIPVNKSEIEHWLVSSSKTTRQPQEKVLPWRVVALENIVEIKQGEVDSLV